MPALSYPLTAASTVMCDFREVMICAQRLTKRFGRQVAVEDVSFDVPHGAIFGFIGPSGSGKTTTIRLLTGVHRPTSGKVTVLGRSPSRFPPSVRAQIGYMPQHFVLYPGLTVWENLNFVASVYGMNLRRRERFEELLDFVELSEHRHKAAQDLSGGMQRRLSLAATMIHDPALLFLDEPTAGVDPILRQKFWGRFRHLRGQGATLFVTTQYVSEAAYCDLVAVMSAGRLVVLDTPEGLRHRAFGGDLVDLYTSRSLEHETLAALRALPFVQRDIQFMGENSIRIVVDEAKTAIPGLIEWCRGQHIEVETIEEYLPPFDDVFVELVRNAESNYA